MTRLRLATSKVLAMTAADVAGLDVATIQIKAYAGVDPTTGKPEWKYDKVRVDAGKREIDRACKALDAKANDLAIMRRERRKNPAAVRPKKVKATTIGEAVEIWWARHGSKLAAAPKTRTLLDSIIIPELGTVAVALTRGTPPDDEDDRDPDVSSHRSAR